MPHLRPNLVPIVKAYPVPQERAFAQPPVMHRGTEGAR